MAFVDWEREVLQAAEDAGTVMIYVSLPDEPATIGIIDALLRDGVRVAAPVMTGKTLEARRITALDELRAGRFDVQEPLGEQVLPEDIDIFFVPGTRFDVEGNRTGRGHGYFNRYLATVPAEKPIIGICWESQLVDRIEPNPWDVPMDRVITAPDR